jgi:hypothetical protein
MPQGEWRVIQLPPLRTLGFALGAVLLAGAAFYAFDSLFGSKTEQVQAKLDGAVAGAAVSNATDAISVVQARASSEISIDGKVTDAQSAINAATDASGADAAGRDGLCAIAASFCPSTSVQQPRPH